MPWQPLISEISRQRTPSTRFDLVTTLIGTIQYEGQGSASTSSQDANTYIDPETLAENTSLWYVHALVVVARLRFHSGDMRIH